MVGVDNDCLFDCLINSFLHQTFGLLQIVFFFNQGGKVVGIKQAPPSTTT
jgi:hypothetical protein